jgi:nicotinate-nucleotide pyrophosphorylase (carboxylating)
MELQEIVRAALAEDVGSGDATTLATVDAAARARATITQKAPGVVFGLDAAERTFSEVDPAVTFERLSPEGAWQEAGTEVLRVEGPARALLTGERTALNLLQRLSGIATLTARYVKAVEGTGVQILDTRKTTPGLRLLEKAAVRAGGGTNHRLNLSAAVLIKDNHLAAVDGDVGLAVRRARDLAPAGTKIEVECDRIEQVQAAVEANADIVMFDNMPPDVMARCVELVAGRAITEASGRVRLENVRAIAQAGVDWISVGSLTHSAPALDLALDFE